MPDQALGHLAVSAANCPVVEGSSVPQEHLGHGKSPGETIHPYDVPLHREIWSLGERF